MRTSKKEKVTVSVDAHLLQLVDAFVSESADEGISRSSVFEDALQLWKQSVRDEFDAAYYAGNRELVDDSWTRIKARAAKDIWRK